MKKIFALLLAMTMMLCVSGAMAEHSGWTALPDGMTTLPDGMKTLSDGKYYLPNDINLGNQSLLINGDVTLCLCSRTLTGSGIFVINIQDGAHLTLQDCGANNSGCILQTWENNAIAGVGGEGRFTMHGGTVKGMNYGISTHSAPQISAGTIEGGTQAVAKYSEKVCILPGSYKVEGAFTETKVVVAKAPAAPAEPADLPSTGDESRLALWLALLGMSAAGMKMRRKNPSVGR